MKKIVTLCAVLFSATALWAQTPVLEVKESQSFAGTPGQQKVYGAEITGGKEFSVAFKMVAQTGGRIIFSKSSALPMNMINGTPMTDNGWRLAVRQSKDDSGNIRLNLRADILSPTKRHFAQCYAKEQDYFAIGKQISVVVTFKSTSADAGCLTVYIDGREVLRHTSVPYAADSTSPFTVGASIDGSEPFKGTISDLKVYDTQLTAKQVAAM